jgi:hypothetical protein
MSLAQNSPPDAWLPAERARDLREPLRLPAVAGSPRLCVILDHAVTLAAPSADTPTAPARRGGSPCRSVQRPLHLRDLSQIPGLLRSVDYGGFMRHLSPFRINTSKFSRSVDSGGLTRNLSPFRINTSKNMGGGGCRTSCVNSAANLQFDVPPEVPLAGALPEPPPCILPSSGHSVGGTELSTR